MIARCLFNRCRHFSQVLIMHLMTGLSVLDPRGDPGVDHSMTGVDHSMPVLNAKCRSPGGYNLC